MTVQFDIRQNPLPKDMQLLLNSHPRESWEGHPNFKDATRQWMGAHQMFRKLGSIISTDTQRFLDKTRSADEYADRLSHYGDALVRNLHGHHHWEDHTYFPELSKADPRFDRGLDILEKDHEVLDEVLDAFTKSANRVIKLSYLDEMAAYDEAGKLHGIVEGIEALLDRHLLDEEDLAVPIIIHHKLRG